jgi:tetraacyldisaccharide 4'-kinase
MTVAERLAQAWYAPRQTAVTALLTPVALGFGALASLRRGLDRRGVLKVQKLPVPVVVIGNVTAGGAGKTPLALALAQALFERGRRPGIVSRGYGGSNVAARAVDPGDDPRIVGDEPLLYARVGLPVWIGHRRVDVARALLAAHANVDVVIADDGLQHYALDRAVEIVVVDVARGFGNGWLLPAGPLREPASRMRAADAIVRLVPRVAASPQGGDGHATQMWLDPLRWRNLARADAVADPRDWTRSSAHAIAGIGNPERFFAQLRSLGIDAVCHAFPDHHAFTPADLAFPLARAILMTEKDAVKCAAFADERFWCLPVRAHIDSALVQLVLARLNGFEAARNARLPGHQGSADLRS